MDIESSFKLSVSKRTVMENIWQLLERQTGLKLLFIVTFILRCYFYTEPVYLLKMLLSFIGQHFI